MIYCRSLSCRLSACAAKSECLTLLLAALLHLNVLEKCCTLSPAMGLDGKLSTPACAAEVGSNSESDLHSNSGGELGPSALS